MAYKDAPCNNCADRCYKCHIECERYKLFSEERKTVNERRKKAREQDKVFYERYFNIIRRANKNKVFKSPKR